MSQEIEQYLEKYPEEIVMLFSKIRDVIYSIESIIIEEKMWAKIPSYYYGEKFVRIIPFKDHINVVNFNCILSGRPSLTVFATSRLRYNLHCVVLNQKALSLKNIIYI